MKRGSEEQSSSLDLLLGPMCNTFGGILFIAILLIILSHSAGSSALDEKQRSEQARRELQAAEQKAEIQRLQQEAMNLAPLVNRAPIITTNIKPAIVQGSNLKELQASNTVVQTDIEQQRAILLQVRQELDSAKRALENRFVTRTNLENQIAQLDKQYQTATNREVRSLRLPRLHTVNKQTVFMAVKGGRLYPVSDISKAYTWQRGYDETYVTVESGPHHDTVSIRSTAGQRIETGAENEGVFRQMLANVSAKNEYISFMVFPDSFAEFNYVKTAVIKKGFEYSWYPSEGSCRIIKSENVHAM